MAKTAKPAAKKKKRFTPRPGAAAPARSGPPRKKKGGPLVSKKPGRNQVARARKTVSGPATLPEETRRSGTPLRGKPSKPRAPRGGTAPRRKDVALAGPQAAPSPAPAARAEAPDPSRPRALAVARAGLDKKAEDVLVLDVRGLTSYADYFVLLTAESERQAGAIADAVDEALEKEGAQRVGVEGYQTGRWILVDYGDVVAHVFSKEARGFYDLESLWADAPRFSVAD